MKKLIFLATFLYTIVVSSQILTPVKWEFESQKVSDTEYELIFIANMDEHWAIYSQFVDDGGPLPTEFVFDESEAISLIDNVIESDENKVTKHDPVFDMIVSKFYNKATFTQKIKLENNEAIVKGSLVFMTCDDEKCLAPTDVPFEFNISSSGISLGQEATIDNVEVSAEDIEKSKALELGITGWDKYEKQEVAKKSNFSIFLLGFLGGLIALLTPCVFPMIPLTVSFFTKSGSNSKKGMANSMLYGFFIFLIYVLLSLPFHLIDSLDPEILNNISTNVTLNIIFFLVFLFFAFSFFGYYELTLPSSWGTALDSKANKIGGVLGVFLMALTLAIVSFSCTGPILGGLLGSTTLATGNIALKLTMGMAGFGLALALPFTLFAMFPNWLNSLPKSGGWLNTVKVVLGFIELALAFKFFSNADLVEHWGLLKREIFIGIWIVISILTAVYLFGKMKFPHDSPLKKLSFSRISFAILFIAITVYLLPGLTNTKHANLKLLSGIAPPMFYSIYEKENNCPLGINCYKDLIEGVEAAKSKNKPIMLDFTGWACVNCRKMEEHVWSKNKVFERLNNDYILISLYVDDRKELKEEQQFNFLKQNGSVKEIRTIGDKWATFQTINFNNNSQPYYVLLNHNMELLNKPIAYTPNGDDYLQWLELGLENFNKEQNY